MTAVTIAKFQEEFKKRPMTLYLAKADKERLLEEARKLPLRSAKKGTPYVANRALIGQIAATPTQEQAQAVEELTAKFYALGYFVVHIDKGGFGDEWWAYQGDRIVARAGHSLLRTESSELGEYAKTLEKLWNKLPEQKLLAP